MSYYIISFNCSFFESTKWRSYGIPSVHSSVCVVDWSFGWSFSREPLVGNFLGFLHEVRVSSKLKSDRARFLKKILLLGFGQNAPKTRFFKCYEKSPRGTFQIFCMMLQKHELLKLTNTSFFGKVLFGGFGVKRGQNGPNMRFYRFYEKLALKFSDFLHEVTPACKFKIDRKEFFGEKPCFEVFGMEMDPNWGFQVLPKVNEVAAA